MSKQKNNSDKKSHAAAEISEREQERKERGEKLQAEHEKQIHIKTAGKGINR